MVNRRTARARSRQASTITWSSRSRPTACVACWDRDRLSRTKRAALAQQHALGRLRLLRGLELGDQRRAPALEQRLDRGQSLVRLGGADDRARESAETSAEDRAHQDD